MRIIKIPKGNGKFRTIYVPSRKEKRELTKINQLLSLVQSNVLNAAVVHGFKVGKSPVTNAETHVGYRYTLTFDLKDFFDTCTSSMFSVYDKHFREIDYQNILKKCFIDDHPRQGLPTSPAIANLCAADMDSWISTELRKYANAGIATVVYTRYADDLTFSSNDFGTISSLLLRIPEIAVQQGFTIADEKTHIYDSQAGMRPITGVAVGNTGIQPTRKVRRKLRAALHQCNWSPAAGLAEWCKLKRPGGAGQPANNLLEYVTGAIATGATP